jgi:hypothetical protein
MPLTIADRLQIAARVLLTGRLPANKQPANLRTDIPAISPEEVAEIKTFFPADKFFIYGHARSGTTLLARLVRLHPDVHCNYQAHFFTRAPLLQALVADQEVGAWLSRRSNRWNHGRDLSPVVLRAAADYIMEREARPLGKRIVGDKSPSSLLDGEAVGLMHNIYPDGSLVFIVRDGRDTALSHRFQAFIDNPQSLSAEDASIRQAFAADPEPFLKGQHSVFSERGIRLAAQGWVRNLAETDRAGRDLYGERYFSLRYEDLLADPCSAMSRLWVFLGAGGQGAGKLEAAIRDEMGHNPDADWQQQKAQEIASPLQKGRQGSWREMFTGRDRQIFQEVAGQTLAEWGYESC